MRNTVIFFLLCFSQTIAAQWSADLLGKKLLTNTAIKQTIAYHVPNAETLVQVKQTLTTNIQVHAASPSQLLVGVEVKRIQGEIDAFGQTQKFDSNKQDSISTEEKKLITDWLSVKQYTLSNIAVLSTANNSLTQFFPEDLRSYFLTENKRGAGIAFNWRDSLQTDSSRSVYECTVLKTTADSILVHVFGKHELKNTIQQANQSFHQVLKGVEQSTRWYEKKTGVLIRTQRLIQYEGTAENQDTRFPISMKIDVDVEVKN